MNPTPRAREVFVEARGKVNLGLAVGPRRADGYHDLATVFQSISLADTLVVRPRARGFSLRVRFEDASLRGRAPGTARAGVPADSSNLVLRAAGLLAARCGIRGGARFELVKRIPARAGLGGGSADAAAALAGLAALYGVRPSRATRLELAARLGSDVPFALVGGTALGLGRGERLTSLNLAKSFRALIVLPRWGISTASAYQALDRRRNHLTQWSANLRFAQLLRRARLRVDRAMQLGNAFESVVGERRREYAALRSRLEDAGATFVRMTGSGSAVVGVLPSGRGGIDVVQRYRGAEALYLVRSMRRGLKLIIRS